MIEVAQWVIDYNFHTRCTLKYCKELNEFILDYNDNPYSICAIILRNHLRDPNYNSGLPIFENILNQELFDRYRISNVI